MQFISEEDYRERLSRLLYKQCRLKAERQEELDDILSRLNHNLRVAEFPCFIHALGRRFQVIGAKACYDEKEDIIYLEGDMHEEGSNVRLELAWKELRLLIGLNGDHYESISSLNDFCYNECLPESIVDAEILKRSMCFIETCQRLEETEKCFQQFRTSRLLDFMEYLAAKWYDAKEMGIIKGPWDILCGVWNNETNLTELKVFFIHSDWKSGTTGLSRRFIELCRENFPDELIHPAASTQLIQEACPDFIRYMNLKATGYESFNELWDVVIDYTMENLAMQYNPMC